LAALALVQIVIAAVSAGYEILTGGLSWPPFLFLVAGVFVFLVERRRRLVPPR
jgi:hypothetical protein